MTASPSMPAAASPRAAAGSSNPPSVTPVAGGGARAPVPVGDVLPPAGTGYQLALVVEVRGAPKPKGSLRHVGHGRMVEQLEGSKPWREAVKWAALEAMATVARRDGWAQIQGPVQITATVTVTKPVSAPKMRRTWPVTRSSGDIDKHARNILDALTDAAVVRDDSQVVSLRIEKCYPGEHPSALPAPGAVIHVWTMT